MTPSRFRFAPSPNGRLHLGHAFSALLNATLADRAGGRFLVRLEDIDRARCPPALAAAALEDLAWLGLAWEEPVRRQSEHLPAYGAALAGVRGLLYPCFCSRSEIAAAVAARGADPPRDPDGGPLYPGTCRSLPLEAAAARLAAGAPHAWRLAMDRALARAPGPHVYRGFDPAGGEERAEVRPGRWGDAVLIRKDTPASYHLAVVHDDALQGITHVVRGQDLEAATDLHVLLQALLGLPTPRYHHHALLRDPDGRKLAKSLSSRPLAALRAAGVTPTQVREALGFEGNGRGAPPAAPDPARIAALLDAR